MGLLMCPAHLSLAVNLQNVLPKLTGFFLNNEDDMTRLYKRSDWLISG